MPKRRTNRRQFLSAQSAVDAVEDFVDGVKDEHRSQPPPAKSPAPQPTYLLELARDAMAVEFQVLLNAGEHHAGPEAAVAALDLLEPLEAQLTVYRDSSEVSRLNCSASDAPVVVEARLFRLLQTAVQIARETGGAYDMTSGPLTKLWGFYRREGRMPSDDEIAATLAHVGYEKLELDETRRTIFFQRSGMEINLGGIGKGYALDRLGQELRVASVDDFLLHGGQSSVLAGGSRRGIDGGEGWRVGLAHPLKADQTLAEFRLVNQALGTSGAGNQFFYHQGRRYGHILDPRTGRPADGVLSSTVIAPTAALADALSTAFYVGGIELARSYCEIHAEVSSLLVTTNQRGQLELTPINLPDGSWRRIDTSGS